MKKTLILIISMLITLSLQAQKINLSGIITDDKGEILIGAVVMEKNTQNGTISNIDGVYSISVSPGATIVCYMLGYVEEEIKVNGLTTLNISLRENTKKIKEVVVIGYGTAKKSDLTSSISSISSNDITSFNTGNVMNAIQTKVNGVQITSSGIPGSNPRVIIRGVTTVNGSDPLYVVDGMPVGTDIRFLNPNDIESMEVLKDASASAIYGTRASNGVVIITTKKGQSGKTKFQFSSNIGISTIKAPKMAGAAEYEQVFKMRYTNDGQISPYNSTNNITDAEGTNWWDQIVNRNSLTQDYNLSFQGGNEKTVYSGSLGYYRADSHYDYGYWDKVTGRINTEIKFGPNVKAGVEFSPKIERWDATPNLMQDAMAMDPTTPVYKADDKWTDNMYSNYERSHNNQVWNPQGNISRMNAHSMEYGMILNPYINVQILEGLSVRTQFGDNARFLIDNDFQPNFYIDNLEQQTISNASRKISINNDWNWTNTANYTKTIDDHNINAMLGFTMEKFNLYWLSGARDAVPANDPSLYYISAGTGNQQATGTDEFNSLLSYLGRVMYNYASKYYLTASIRWDGSSKFPKGNKFATFPSISAAWKITGEEFMSSQTIFNNLKLRLGWGRVGNQNINSNAYLSTIGTEYYTLNNAVVTGSAVASTANPNIQWETVEDYNMGIDIGFLKGRLNCNFDIFRKKTRDMLLKEANMLYLGYPEWAGEIWTNVGSMEASGWELSINWKDQINHDLGYEIGANISSIRNKARDLGASSPILTQEYNGDYIIRNESNNEISRFYGYKCLGIFQNWEEVLSYTNEYGDRLQPNAKPGDLIFADLDNNGTLDSYDKTFIGNAFPKLYLGLNMAVTYKEWELSMNLYGTFGNKIYNTTKGFYSGSMGENVFADTYSKAWWYEGQDTNIPRLTHNDENQNFTRVSDWFVENGSYLKCKQIQLAYTVPETITGNYRLKLTLSGQNLFTITKYSGMDPETAALGSVVESGVDRVAYPNPKIILFGANLSF